MPGLPPPLAAALLPWVTQKLGGDLDGPRQTDEVRRGMAIYALAPRPEIGTTPHEVVHRQDKLALRFYAPARPNQDLPPVVIIPSMINKAAICDLEEERSLVAGLAARGHRVYLVDWGAPGPENAQDDVAWVLLTLLRRAIDRACRHAGAPQATLLGYCQGGTLAAIYAALRPTRVAGLIALAAPVRFSEGGRFRSFVDPATFDPDKAINADGLIGVDLMQATFRMLDPFGNWSRFRMIAKAAEDPRQLQRVMARERWLEENIPMAGAFAREFVKKAYQQDALLAGTWIIAGERVDLSHIRCRLAVYACEGDFISPKEACTPLAEAVSSTDITVETLPTGHIGVVVGSYGPREFYGKVDGWLRAANQALTEPSAPPHALPLSDRSPR